MGAVEGEMRLSGRRKLNKQAAPTTRAGQRIPDEGGGAQDYQRGERRAAPEG